MKIYIDGFGFVADSITRKIVFNHNVHKDDILVNTYDVDDNSNYIRFLNEENIEYSFSSYKEKKTIHDIESFSPDYILSLYGRRILPDAVLRLANRNTLNLHPSLLPKYKGCFSAPWVIINQETVTGITFHQMIERVDAGCIFYQREIKLRGDETGYSLYHKLASSFVQEFDLFFTQFMSDSLRVKPMPAGGTYHSRRVPYDGKINPRWDKPRIDAFIGALFFPPKGGALLERDGEFLECSSMEEYLNHMNSK